MSVPPPAPAGGGARWPAGPAQPHPPEAGAPWPPPAHWGPGEGLASGPAQGPGPPAKWHSFKMLVDPLIHRGAPKIVRYDGSTVPGNPHHIPPTPIDPRKKLPSALWRRLESMDLPVPRLRIDDNYIGEPPKVEVTIENLNDNVDQHFLHAMIAKFGVVEEMVIHHHPANRKHLGLARLVFEQVSSAKACVASLHGKSVMGKCLNCYIDPFGRSCRRMFEDLTTEQKSSAPEAEPDPPEAEEPAPPSRSEERKRTSPTEAEGSRWRERRESRDGEYRRRSSRDRRTHDRQVIPRWPIERAGPLSGLAHVTERPMTHTPLVYFRDWSNDSGDNHRGQAGQRPPPRSSANAHATGPPAPEWERSHSHPGADPPASGAAQPTPDVPEKRSLGPPPPTGSHPTLDSQYLPTHFDPNYNQPEYWLQQAQSYAAAASVHAAQLTTQPSDPAPPPHLLALPVPTEITASAIEAGLKVESNEIPPDGAAVGAGEGEHEDEHKLDLDTRLKMLMKDKSVPAFLLQEFNAASESESEKEAENPAPQVEDGTNNGGGDLPNVFPLQPDEVPLDRAPSPFLSSDHYLACHKAWVAEKRRKSALDSGEGDFQAGRTKRPVSRNSDQMSLSSLSSGDNNILEQGPDYGLPPYGYCPPPVPGGALPPGYPADWTHPTMDPYRQYQYDPNMPPQFGYGNGQYGHTSWTDPFGRYEGPEKAAKSSKDAYRDLIKDSVNCIVKDLKRTLRKDMNKRMCETFAFFLFEKWWQEQEEKYKTRNQRLASKSEKPSSSSSSTARVPSFTPVKPEVVVPPTSSASPTKLSKAEDITNFFDKQRENMDSATNSAMGGAFGKGGSLGFSFRGIIPKLPSFKKKSTTKERKKGGSEAKGKVRDSSDEGHQ
eukprot:maker-scaffold1877_size25834-snap-gene-0.7 protein:Tk00095 transcript:maker-scaffold1877_size25834-snap-gene-0.7-mRNA-1 annotation:"hypothetical protein AND_009677"